MMVWGEPRPRSGLDVGVLIAGGGVIVVGLRRAIGALALQRMVWVSAIGHPDVAGAVDHLAARWVSHDVMRRRVTGRMILRGLVVRRMLAARIALPSGIAVRGGYRLGAVEV